MPIPAGVGRWRTEGGGRRTDGAVPGLLFDVRTEPGARAPHPRRSAGRRSDAAVPIGGSRGETRRRILPTLRRRLESRCDRPSPGGAGRDSIEVLATWKRRRPMPTSRNASEQARMAATAAARPRRSWESEWPLAGGDHGPSGLRSEPCRVIARGAARSTPDRDPRSEPSGQRTAWPSLRRRCGRPDSRDRANAW